MAENMALDLILCQITSGLTGEDQTDIAYLKEQMERYKDHELGREIARACARLIYDRIPEGKKEEYTDIIDNGVSGIRAALDEVHFNIYRKNFDKALGMIEAMVRKVEALSMFEDDEVSEYHVFDELFEEIIYTFRSRPKKKIRRVSIPFTEMYFLYGNLLFELERIEEARKALKTALRWNPVNTHSFFEYTETYKATGDLDTFFRLTLDAFKIAFHAPDVARCYRNLGYYFVERELYSVAIGCYLLSLQFEPNAKQVQSELYFINAKTGGSVPDPTFEETKRYAEQYGFPVGADGDILGLSYSLGNQCHTEKNYPTARYFWTITCQLTDDPEIRELLDQLPEEDD